MKNKKMLIMYDEDADILEIYFDKIQEGHFKELKNKCFERIDKSSGRVVGYSIFNFSKRKDKFVELTLPLPKELFV